MKKHYFIVAIAFLLLTVTGCSKEETNSFSASVTATVGTTSYSSTKNNVNVGESGIVAGGTVGGTEQVTITATNDAASDSYLVIAFGYAANDVKSYSVASKQAICAYHKSGTTNDDLAVSGTVTITSNDASDVSLGKHLMGTFDFTTQSGVHVVGNFSVQVNY
jgi:curli biogenesis system outer membrane secretion channel CsgG